MFTFLVEYIQNTEDKDDEHMQVIDETDDEEGCQEDEVFETDKDYEPEVIGEDEAEEEVDEKTEKRTKEKRTDKESSIAGTPKTSKVSSMRALPNPEVLRKGGRTIGAKHLSQKSAHKKSKKRIR